MLSPPLLFWFIILRAAKVPRVLLLLDEDEDDESFWGDKALATAKVVNALEPNPLWLDDPPPFMPPFTAKSVAAGEFPNELITTASVVDIWLLLSIATAANGLTFPLATPESNTIFFSGSSCWEL